MMQPASSAMSTDSRTHLEKDCGGRDDVQACAGRRDVADTQGSGICLSQLKPVGQGFVGGHWLLTRGFTAGTQPRKEQLTSSLSNPCDNARTQLRLSFHLFPAAQMKLVCM